MAVNKVKQILQWYTEGVPKLQISLKTGVSRNSVKSYIRQFIAMDKSLEEILCLKDSELEQLFLSKVVKEPEHRLKELIAFFPDHGHHASGRIWKPSRTAQAAVAPCP